MSDKEDIIKGLELVLTVYDKTSRPLEILPGKSKY
jgi:hypothetical protein